MVTNRRTAVHRRSPFFLLLAFALLFGASRSSAAPRDNAANQKIEEAINKFYLATEFDKAETLLKGVLEACEDRCSPAVKARAWMYVGVVRGSGRQDMAGAGEAFQQAITLDPQVKLDDALATPAVRQAFATAAGGGAPAAGKEEPAPAAATPSGGGMECTPNVKEVESQRPIPVACTTDEPAAKVTLRYLAFGGDKWQSVALTKKGEYWQGEVPCSDTGATGKIKFYVQAQDKDGTELDSSGNKATPNAIDIVATTTEEPPSYPGQTAPAKCMEASACPDDMIGTPACPGTGKGRGNKGWGAPCNVSNECDTGLLCTPGDNGRTCESAPSCDNDDSCPSGTVCKGGTCDVPVDNGGEAEKPEGPAEPYKKNWLGLHFAGDIAFLSGKGVCTSGDYTCYYGGDVPVDGRGIIAKNYSGNLNGGGTLATVRVLFSYERLFSQHIGLEGRLGFAFNGGPKAADGTSFLPLHAEARLKYWFRNEGFSKKGFRPFVLLGGGIAQVDGKLTVSVGDCTVPGSTPPVAVNPTCQATGSGAHPAKLIAYKKLGQSFITVGGGAMYAFNEKHGLVLNLNLMYMLGSSGPVIEPSLGYELGL
jgi:hypothetical protein